MPPPTRLFIYGTLKRRCRNAHVLSGARYVGRGRTQCAQYTMAAVVDGADYAYPAMCAGGSSFIAGEVYALDTALLAAIDAFELNGIEYDRQSIALSDGTTADAYIWRAACDRAIAMTNDHIIYNKADNTFMWQE